MNNKQRTGFSFLFCFLDDGEGAGQELGACAVVAEQDNIQNVRERNDTGTGGFDSNGECPNCVQKTIELEELRQKYDDQKKLLMKLSLRHTQVDLKYNDLLNATTGRERVVDDAAAVNGDLFTVNELKFLCSMPLDQTKDSTFVHQCLKFVYKHNMAVLVNKTLMGTKESIEIEENGEQIHHGGKGPLTPVKVDRIRELYIDRIAKCDIGAVAYGVRIGNINKHFASAIKNIAKRQH